MRTDSVAAPRRKHTRIRIRVPYRLITRAADGRLRTDQCMDVNAFKARLAALDENEGVSFDEIVDTLDAS
jgi:hypothetical protein